MVSINNVSLLGEIASEIVTTRPDAGAPYVTCSVLVTETGSNGLSYKTFLPCLAFGKAAERLAELEKGTVVGIAGKLSWRAAKDGKAGHVAVVIRDIEIDDER
jgi:single-stranded DNA-binding protein